MSHYQSYNRFSSLPTAARLGIALLLPIGILGFLMMGLLPSPSSTVRAAPLSPGYIDLSDWVHTDLQTSPDEASQWHCPPSATGAWSNFSVDTNNKYWVNQTENAEDPTFYVSPASVPFSTTVSGNFGAYGDGTTDYFGFVFAYQEPQTKTRNFEFALVDWSWGECSANEGSGVTLGKVDYDYSNICVSHAGQCEQSGDGPPPGGTQGDYVDWFWITPKNLASEDLGCTVLASDASTANGPGGNCDSKGWKVNTMYTFTYSYTQNSAHVIIYTDTVDNPIFDLSCNAATNSYCTFKEGRFGFYNYSQHDTMYGRFEATNPDVTVVANDDYYEVGQDDTLETHKWDGVLVNDLSPLTVLSATTQTNPSHGQVVLNLDGSFVYTPDLGFTGVDTFTYQAEDDFGNTSTATVYIVVAPADLAVSKRDWLDPAVANEPLTYTLVITNYGPADATDVVLTDTLPPGSTFSAASAGCNHVGGTPGDVVCAVGPLNNQATATITVVVTAPATGGLIPITNTAVVTWAGSFDPVPSNNTAKEGTRVSAEADLRVSKHDFPDPATAGGPLTYTLVITNVGPHYAGEVVFTDDLPSGVMYDNVLLLHMDEAAGSTTFKDTSGRGNHASYTGCSNHYPPIAGISGPSGFDQALRFGEYDYVQIYPFNDFPNTEITVMFWVSSTNNANPTPFSYNVNGQDNELMLYDIDDLKVYIKATYCTPGVDFIDGTWHHLAVTWRSSDGRVQVYKDGNYAGGCSSFHDGETLKDAGSLVFGQEQDGTSSPFCNFSSAGHTPLIGDLDEVVIYSRTLSADEINEHYNQSVSTFVASQGSCSIDGELDCDLGLMAPNDVVSIALRVNVRSATRGYITNTAAATSYVPDPSPLNNTITETTLVGRMPNLKPSKEAPNGLAQSPLTWTITVDNLGPSDAGNVVLTDTLTGDIDSYGPISTTHGSCGDWDVVGNVGTFTCALGYVSVQVPPRITLVVTPSLHAGMLTNTVTVTETQSQSYERDPTDNTFTDTTPVGDIDLGIAKTVNAGDFDPRGTVVYTITVVNHGPEPATGVVVSDTLPVGLTDILSDTTQGIYDDTTGIWNVGDLNAGFSATLRITSTLDVMGQTLTNTATLSGSTPIDIIYYNNTATVSITVSSLFVGGHTEPAGTSASLWSWIVLLAAVSGAIVVTVAIRRRLAGREFL